MSGERGEALRSSEPYLSQKQQVAWKVVVE